MTILSDRRDNSRAEDKAHYPFVMVPVALIQRPSEDNKPGSTVPGRLTADQLALYVALRSRIDNPAGTGGATFSGRGRGECYPGRAWLAKSMGLSENSRKSVDKSMAALVEMGIVQRLRRWEDDSGKIQHCVVTPRQGSSLYRVSIDGTPLDTDDEWGRAVSIQLEGGVSGHQGVVSGDTRGGVSGHHGVVSGDTTGDVSGHQGVVSDDLTIKNHLYQEPFIEDPTHTNRPQRVDGSPGEVSDHDFETWWSTYPRRNDKPKTREAYSTALATGISANALLDAAQRHRDDPNRVDRYTKYSANWLKAEAWHDDPVPEDHGDGLLRGSQIASKLASMSFPDTEPRDPWHDFDDRRNPNHGISSPEFEGLFSFGDDSTSPLDDPESECSRRLRELGPGF